MSVNFAPRAISKARASWGLFLLVLMGLLGSLMIGSSTLLPGTVWQALTHFNPDDSAHVVLWELRAPRTILALGAGGALGLSGALMQALTRNPLAEPGLLGINAGAAVAVVLGVSLLSLAHIRDYIWLGWLGAGLAGLAVFSLGGAWRGNGDPIRLVLAGSGVSILLGAIVGLVVLNSQLDILDLFRTWGSGSLQNRGWESAWLMMVMLGLGLVICLSLTPSLNALALGAEMAAALGLRTMKLWIFASLALLILAGSATATAGPIVFLGLISAHLARAIFGVDWRLCLPASGAIGAAVLLISDICGRLIAFPAEVSAGIMVMLLGAPIFLNLLRKIKIGQS